MNKNLVLPYILVCHTCGAPNVPHLHLVYRDETRSPALQFDPEILAEIDEAVRVGKLTIAESQMLKQPIEDFGNISPEIFEQMMGELGEDFDRLALPFLDGAEEILHHKIQH